MSIVATCLIVTRASVALDIIVNILGISSFNWKLMVVTVTENERDTRMPTIRTKNIFSAVSK